jgi:hypothetical protein
MPREGAIIFRDLVGNLEVLNVECDKCGRRGRYRLDRLIMRYGIDAKLFDWSDEITSHCPRKQAKNLNDMCGAVPGFVDGCLMRRGVYRRACDSQMAPPHKPAVS